MTHSWLTDSIAAGHLLPEIHYKDDSPESLRASPAKALSYSTQKSQQQQQRRQSLASFLHDWGQGTATSSSPLPWNSQLPESLSTTFQQQPNYAAPAPSRLKHTTGAGTAAAGQGLVARETAEAHEQLAGSSALQQAAAAGHPGGSPPPPTAVAARAGLSTPAPAAAGFSSPLAAAAAEQMLPSGSISPCPELSLRVPSPLHMQASPYQLSQPRSSCKSPSSYAGAFEFRPQGFTAATSPRLCCEPTPQQAASVGLDELLTSCSIEQQQQQQEQVVQQHERTEHQDKQKNTLEVPRQKQHHHQQEQEGMTSQQHHQQQQQQRLKQSGLKHQQLQRQRTHDVVLSLGQCSVSPLAQAPLLHLSPVPRSTLAAAGLQEGSPGASAAPAGEAAVEVADSEEEEDEEGAFVGVPETQPDVWDDGPAAATPRSLVNYLRSQAACRRDHSMGGGGAEWALQQQQQEGEAGQDQEEKKDRSHGSAELHSDPCIQQQHKHSTKKLQVLEQHTVKQQQQQEVKQRIEQQQQQDEKPGGSQSAALISPADGAAADARDAQEGSCAVEDDPEPPSTLSKMKRLRRRDNWSAQVLAPTPGGDSADEELQDSDCSSGDEATAGEEWDGGASEGDGEGEEEWGEGEEGIDEQGGLAGGGMSAGWKQKGGDKGVLKMVRTGGRRGRREHQREELAAAAAGGGRGGRAAPARTGSAEGTQLREQEQQHEMPQDPSAAAEAEVGEDASVLCIDETDDGEDDASTPCSDACAGVSNASGSTAAGPSASCSGSSYPSSYRPGNGNLPRIRLSFSGPSASTASSSSKGTSQGGSASRRLHLSSRRPLDLHRPTAEALRSKQQQQQLQLHHGGGRGDNCEDEATSSLGRGGGKITQQQQQQQRQKDVSFVNLASSSDTVSQGVPMEESRPVGISQGQGLSSGCPHLRPSLEGSPAASSFITMRRNGGRGGRGSVAGVEESCGAGGGDRTPDSQNALAVTASVTGRRIRGGMGPLEEGGQGEHVSLSLGAVVGVNGVLDKPPLGVEIKQEPGLEEEGAAGDVVVPHVSGDGHHLEQQCRAQQHQQQQRQEGLQLQQQQQWQKQQQQQQQNHAQHQLQQQQQQRQQQGQEAQKEHGAVRKAAAASRATPSLGKFVPPKVKQEQHYHQAAVLPHIDTSSYSHNTATASCSTATAATTATTSGSLVPLAAVNSRAVTLEDLGRAGGGGAALQELLARAIEGNSFEAVGAPPSVGAAAGAAEGGVGLVQVKEEQMEWEAHGGGGRGNQAGTTPDNAGEAGIVEDG